MSKLPTRRHLLGTISGLLTATGGATMVGGSESGGTPAWGGDPSVDAAAAASKSATQGRRSFSIMAGTEHETTVYERTASADGPTVFVVAGVHGDEECGYLTAENVLDWAVDAGRLVVLPRANVVAIEADNRDGESGDLNRQFPADAEPTSELARAIWAVVAEYDPDVVVDLHQADGIYTRDQEPPEEEVGQAIFHSGDDAANLANEMANTVNRTVVPDSRSRYFFLTSTFDLDAPPNGLLATKAAQDLDSDGLLVEVTEQDLAIETQVAWQTALVRTLLEGLVITADDGGDGGNDDDGDGDGDDADEPENAPPTARIETTPANATAVDFDRGDTVTFDASASTDDDGDVATYEWAIATDSFQESGATADYTFDACGTIDATVRVTDDDGATDTATVTVSTADQG